MDNKKIVDINECIFEKEYREVVPYEVNIKCPKCKTGYLIGSMADIKTINGESYCIHTCNNPNCNNKESVKDLYPKIVNFYRESLNEEKENEKSITTNKKCSCPIKRIFRRK